MTCNLLSDDHVQVLIRERKGNSVRFGDGPAAVIGDECRDMPLAEYLRGTVISSFMGSRAGKARLLG